MVSNSKTIAKTLNRPKKGSRPTSNKPQDTNLTKRKPIYRPYALSMPPEKKNIMKAEI